MITLKDVCVNFENNEALKHCTLNISDNDFICIIGKNGSGKSTLLKAMSSIIPYQGMITCNHIDLQTLTKQNKAKIISYLPQHKEIPCIPVKDLIAHGRFPHLSFSKVMKQEDLDIVYRAAKMADVDHLMERCVTTLSGGERQRVYIAMMIAQDAKILLLDEPTIYLDLEHQLEVFQLLKKLNALGKIIVIVVHDLSQAFSFSKKIILLEDGIISLQGKCKDIYQDARIYQNFQVRLERDTNSQHIYQYQLRK